MVTLEEFRAGILKEKHRREQGRINNKEARRLIDVDNAYALSSRRGKAYWQKIRRMNHK